MLILRLEKASLLFPRSVCSAQPAKTPNKRQSGQNRSRSGRRWRKNWKKLLSTLHLHLKVKPKWPFWYHQKFLPRIAPRYDGRCSIRPWRTFNEWNRKDLARTGDWARTVKIPHGQLKLIYMRRKLSETLDKENLWNIMLNIRFFFRLSWFLLRGPQHIFPIHGVSSKRDCG